MNDYLVKVSEYSKQKYEEIRKHFDAAFFGEKEYEHVCVYACGSMGRLDMSTNSDLDLFFIEDNTEEETLTEKKREDFFLKVREINKEMGFQEPSRNGAFLKFTKKEDMLDIGSQTEDYNNSFTARLLLLLESKPLYNDALYYQLIEDTVDKYLCDFEDHQDDFSPLFIMNDILRYWYTLTLNYEFRRDPNDSDYKKRWRRLKLKFARLFTCFSLYICLFRSSISHEYVKNCIYLTPIERLEMLSDAIPEASSIVISIEEEYKWYLELRNQTEEWWSKEENKASAYEHANRFHSLVTHKLMKVVSLTNPNLLEKTELNF